MGGGCPAAELALVLLLLLLLLLLPETERDAIRCRSSPRGVNGRDGIASDACDASSPSTEGCGCDRRGRDVAAAGRVPSSDETSDRALAINEAIEPLLILQGWMLQGPPPPHTHTQHTHNTHNTQPLLAAMPFRQMLCVDLVGNGRWPSSPEQQQVQTSPSNRP